MKKDTTMPAHSTTKSYDENSVKHDETFGCHELIDEYTKFRTNARFWLEGVLLLIVGIFGIIGNFLSILVLPRCPGNRNFNLLLM